MIEEEVQKVGFDYEDSQEVNSTSNLAFTFEGR